MKLFIKHRKICYSVTSYPSTDRQTGCHANDQHPPEEVLTRDMCARRPNLGDSALLSKTKVLADGFNRWHLAGVHRTVAEGRLRLPLWHTSCSAAHGNRAASWPQTPTHLPGFHGSRVTVQQGRWHSQTNKIKTHQKAFYIACSILKRCAQARFWP